LAGQEKQKARETMATSGPGPAKDFLSGMAYPNLLERKEAIIQRLDEVAVLEAQPPKRKIVSSSSRNNGASAKSRKLATISPTKHKVEAVHNNNGDHHELVPYEPKGDTHWDFVMKEMMWLGADFQAERKRQTSLAKKLAGAIRQHHKTKESRRLRELAEAELKRRRLAGRISRELRGWWTKIERVVAYKQKLSADEERKKAMNKQLVALVKQTERYSESLMLQQQSCADDDDNDDDDDDDMDDSVNNSRDDSHGESSEKDSRQQQKQQRRRRQPQHHELTIEEALASEQLTTRKSKARVIDYSRLRLAKGDDALYGESTASDSGSDASYTPESEMEDDETTLREAELHEIEQRKGARKNQNGQNSEPFGNEDTTESFMADPEEIRRLQEEADMDIDLVLERLRSEASTMETTDILESDDKDYPDTTTNDLKRVKFAPTVLAKDTIITADTLEKIEEKKISGNASEGPLNRAVSAIAPLPASAIDTGSDADDDGDASDVEDYVAKVDTDDIRDKNSDSDGEGSEEYQVDETEVDDETTMAAEELLPREMCVEEEINLLKRESEMSIEELRARYANMEDSNPAPSEDDDDDDDDDEEEEEEEEEEKDNDNDNNNNNDNDNGSKNEDKISKSLNGDTNPSEPSTIQSTTVDAIDSDIIESGQSIGVRQDWSGENHVAHQNGDVGEIIAKTEQPVTVDATAATDITSAAPSVLNVPAKADASPKKKMDDSNSKSDDMTPDGISEPSDSFSGPRNLLDGGATHKDETGGNGSNLDHAENSDSQGDDEEFQPPLQPELDDETTMEAEEKLGRDMSYEEEMLLLRRESEIPVEQLRAMYAAMEDNDEGVESESDVQSDEKLDAIYLHIGVVAQEDEKAGKGSDLEDTWNSDTQDDDEEFHPPIEPDLDDETTMEAEEKLGRAMSHEEEMLLLKREGEIPVEQLRAMYAAMENDEGVELESGDQSGEELDETVDDKKIESHKTDGEAVDEESKMEIQEKVGRVARVKRESEISPEDQRTMQTNTQTESDSEETGEAKKDLRLLNEGLDDTDADANDDEFEPEDDAVDDETTMEAEEMLGREMSVDEEIAALKRDGEVSIESLLDMYNKMNATRPSSSCSEDEKPTKRKADARASESISKKPRGNQEEETSDDGLAALSVLEASAERARKTLASRPYFMANWVKLREYQQVGLNWLVSLQSRRLNGILADGK
jgi:hypothetical protein